MDEKPKKDPWSNRIKIHLNTRISSTINFITKRSGKNDRNVANSPHATNTNSPHHDDDTTHENNAANLPVTDLAAYWKAYGLDQESCAKAHIPLHPKFVLA